MRELYVYYRIRDTDAAAAGQAARSMQDALRAAHPGLTARLLTRAGAGEALQTWMEIYSRAAPSQGVDAALEGSIEMQAARWAHLVAGPRHIEAFIAVADA